MKGSKVCCSIIDFTAENVDWGLFFFDPLPWGHDATELRLEMTYPMMVTRVTTQAHKKGTHLRAKADQSSVRRIEPWASVWVDTYVDILNRPTEYTAASAYPVFITEIRQKQVQVMQGSGGRSPTIAELIAPNSRPAKRYTRGTRRTNPDTLYLLARLCRCFDMTCTTKPYIPQRKNRGTYRMRVQYKQNR